MTARVPPDLEPPGAGELCGLSCAQLVNQLALQPHPEGGWYREVHRSGVQVRRADGAVRCALTQILYLLPAGGISRWHRVCGADETWLFVAGAPLELWQLPPEGGTAATCCPLGSGRHALAVVPSGWWQAARASDGWSLVSCAVGPGFEFEDFELLASRPAAARPTGVRPEFL